jgi:hypothetical protein
VGQTSACAAECRVVALCRSVTGVEALETGDVADLKDCWRVADGGQVAYCIASLAVVAIHTGNREAGVLQDDIAFYPVCTLLLLEGLIVPGLLLGLLILSLLLLLRLLGLLLLVVVLAVAVTVVLVSRVVLGPPIGPVGTLRVGMARATGRVHVASITRLGRRRVDPDVSTIRVVGVVVAGITITIAVTIAVTIAIAVAISIAILV